MSEAVKYKGRCFMAMENQKEALIAFKEAIENDDKDAELYSMFFLK